MADRIQNGEILVEVNRSGAELSSIKSLRGGVEHLWQGDPTHWPRRSPVLFPIVGRLKGDSYMWRGAEYKLGQHGFARDREFRLLLSGPTALKYELLSDDWSRSRYPFDFALRLGYSLSGARLDISYGVKNTGRDPMPFSIGAHPGFACPLFDGESFGDYRLEFDRTENAVRHFLKDGLLAKETEPFLLDQKTFGLSHALFERGAMIFKGLRSKKVSLVGPRGGGSTLDMAGWPYLGIWTKPGAPFVCIEPWQGLADPEGFAGEFGQREGTVTLEPGGSFEKTVSISLGMVR